MMSAEWMYCNPEDKGNIHMAIFLKNNIDTKKEVNTFTSIDYFI